MTKSNEVRGVEFEIVGVRVTTEDIGIVVRVHWSGVDRPTGLGIVCANQKIASRLEQAIRAGAAVEGVGVLRDNFGSTFVDERWHVRARVLNADLKRLGF